ncbi:MAG: TolC family protein [Nitrospiraceae bacterium]|nr:MAG: TolC family protein [Nitrospiraceae bacterium]
MKRMLLCVCMIFTGFAAHAAEYSLDDLYRLALERSNTVQIASENKYIAEREKDRAMAVLIPKFSAFGSYTKYVDEQENIQPDNSTSWGLRLDQSLSVSRKELTALKIAKASIVKSGYDLDSVKEEYLLTVASAYFNVLKAKKSEDIAKANVERLTKYRDAAQTRLRVGEITKTVLLRAEAELAGAQSESIRAENALKLARAVLARTVRIEGDYDIIESKGTLYESAVPGCFMADDSGSAQSLECLKETALQERHELKAAELEKQIAEKQVLYTKGSYWPDISVEGVYSRREDHPATSFASDKNIYGLIRLNYPFFEGGLRKAEVRQSEARFRQAEHSFNDLRDSVNVEVDNAYLNLNTETGVLERLRAEVEYARDNYNAVTKQFEYGLADSLDVMDANNLLVTSERQLANAQYDYELAILQLRRATGKLLKTVVMNVHSSLQ